MHVCIGAYMLQVCAEIRAQCAGLGSLLPSYGSGDQTWAWKLAPLPAKPSHRSRKAFFKETVLTVPYLKTFYAAK